MTEPRWDNNSVSGFHHDPIHNLDSEFRSENKQRSIRSFIKSLDYLGTYFLNEEDTFDIFFKSQKKKNFYKNVRIKLCSQNFF